MTRNLILESIEGNLVKICSLLKYASIAFFTDSFYELINSGPQISSSITAPSIASSSIFQFPFSSLVHLLSKSKFKQPFIILSGITLYLYNSEINLTFPLIFDLNLAFSISISSSLFP